MKQPFSRADRLFFWNSLISAENKNELKISIWSFLNSTDVTWWEVAYANTIDNAFCYFDGLWWLMTILCSQILKGVIGSSSSQSPQLRIANRNSRFHLQDQKCLSTTNFAGYIYVGDGCWRPNTLVTDSECWWPI